MKTTDPTKKNPGGKYPICSSRQRADPTKCHRCGLDITREERTCPAVKPDDRWGPMTWAKEHDELL